MIRLTAYISGRVQRTGYRAKVVSLAKEMGLVGFVQNRPEGLVLVIAEGENKDDLERLASAIKIKNALIDVESISAEYSHGSGEYSIFRKITGPEEVGERLDDGIEILKELVVGVNKLVVGVNNLNIVVNNVDVGVKKLDAGINNIDVGVKKLDAGINNIDAGIKKLDTGLNNLTTITKDGFGNLNGKMDRMLEKQDETIEEIRGLREDTMRRSDPRLSRIEKDIRLIKSKVGIR
ncbi:MAG: acylphosphatase [Methanothrix sp.]|nr:acylphosphatase [Methanothrix sp.]